MPSGALWGQPCSVGMLHIHSASSSELLGTVTPLRSAGKYRATGTSKQRRRCCCCCCCRLPAGGGLRAGAALPEEAADARDGAATSRCLDRRHLAGSRARQPARHRHPPRQETAAAAHTAESSEEGELPPPGHDPTARAATWGVRASPAPRRRRGPRMQPRCRPAWRGHRAAVAARSGSSRPEPRARGAAVSAGAAGSATSAPHSIPSSRTRRPHLPPLSTLGPISEGWPSPGRPPPLTFLWPGSFSPALEGFRRSMVPGAGARRSAWRGTDRSVGTAAGKRTGSRRSHESSEPRSFGARSPGQEEGSPPRSGRPAQRPGAAPFSHPRTPPHRRCWAPRALEQRARSPSRPSRPTAVRFGRPPLWGAGLGRGQAGPAHCCTRPALTPFNCKALILKKKMQ